MKRTLAEALSSSAGHNYSRPLRDDAEPNTPVPVKLATLPQAPSRIGKKP